MTLPLWVNSPSVCALLCTGCGLPFGLDIFGRGLVEGLLPKSVFSLGNGLSSVEAWFSTALDIEEVLSGTGGDQLQVMVSDVIKSFDTVDRSVRDCALGRLGLPGWFRRAFFLFIVRVVLGLR